MEKVRSALTGDSFLEIRPKTDVADLRSWLQTDLATQEFASKIRQSLITLTANENALSLISGSFGFEMGCLS